MNESVITREGLDRLNHELERLVTDGRREVAERLRDLATSEANLIENGDYFTVREEQAMLEHRIAVLQERLRRARVVDPQLGNGRIDVGERVRLSDLASGERFELELVGPLESNPAAGRISIASPLGAAILGLRRGQIADVDAPRGKLRYKVLAVETPAPSRTR